jgi:hypothetical protein
MTMQPEHPAIRTQQIVFPNGNCAYAAFLPSNTNPLALLPALNIPLFTAIIMIAGGAGKMDQNLYPKLAPLFTHGIAQFAATRNALIIDGGTQSGVMEMMGQGISNQQHKSALLGISPHGNVSYPGKSEQEENAHLTPLDPNHSHFVLVDTKEWGGETATMYTLAQALAQNNPSLAIVINGGAIALKEVVYNVRQQRPMIILEGSGRIADDIARLWKEKPTNISDPALAEVIQHGNIYLFPITNSETELVQLARRLLN